MAPDKMSNIMSNRHECPHCRILIKVVHIDAAKRLMTHTTKPTERRKAVSPRCPGSGHPI